LIRATGWFHSLANGLAVSGQSDGDGDVDWAELAALALGINGPFVEQSVSDWHFFDLDRDRRVDLRNFAVQRTYSH
jgi:hypothetical protein